MKTISVLDYKAKVDAGEDVVLIDVREEVEYEHSNIGGVHIPLGSLLSSLDKIRKDGQVVVHCRSGKRSANAIMVLEQQYGYNNLYNLTGGIQAYAAEIDNSIDVF